VLAALVYTSLAVALGFAALGISGFTPIQHLGLLTAGVMLLCLLADLLLLPALLLRLRPTGSRKPD
jgi:predicted RND superfamily exporter protein